MISARKENCSPRDLCEKNLKTLKGVFDDFLISTDIFSSTMNSSHTRIVQDVFSHLYENGFIQVREITQLYSETSQMFLPDRFVSGICPHCEAPDARGDQCDKCGKLLDPFDLKNPRSTVDGSIPVARKTQHYFLDLESIRPLLAQSIENRKSEWTSNAYTMAKSFVDRPLEARCITRDLEWGVPVNPELAKKDLGTESKVFYVWFDAIFCYLSFLEEGGKKVDEWWVESPSTEIVQFFGKDNIYFHAILLPGILMATSKGRPLPYSIVDRISATEYLNYEGDKFSKSRNYGIFCDVAMTTGISPDIWRYYLLSIRPETNDANFSWDDFARKVNEFADTVGNFVHRILTFRQKHFPNITESLDSITIFDVLQICEDYKRAMTNVELREGLQIILRLASYGNERINSRKIWTLIKEGRREDKETCEKEVAHLLGVVALVAKMLTPFTPTIAGTIQKYLVDSSSLSVLIPKVTPAQIVEFKKRFGSNSP